MHKPFDMNQTLVASSSYHVIQLLKAHHFPALSNCFLIEFFIASCALYETQVTVLRYLIKYQFSVVLKLSFMKVSFLNELEQFSLLLPSPLFAQQTMSNISKDKGEFITFNVSEYFREGTYLQHASVLKGSRDGVVERSREKS
jgi:hypothetical protein